MRKKIDLTIFRVDPQFYPGMNSMYRPKQSNGYVSGGLPSSEPCSTIPGITTRCECGSRQCEWFIFDNKLAVPEFIIDFEYITRVCFLVALAESRVTYPVTMASACELVCLYVDTFKR